VHPTGFSDTPTGFKESAERPLILCAEILRGVGAVVLAKDGGRFVNELDTRKAVTAAMDAKGEGNYVLALPPQAHEKVATHVHIYTGKGLLHRVQGAAGVAQFINSRRADGDGTATAESVAATFEETSGGGGVNRTQSTTLPVGGEYLVGMVQPVLHYTMGGLAIDKFGNLLDENENGIPGLYAAGEVVGGVHGINRLGGSSLLDCVTFGISTAKAAAERSKALQSVTDAAPAAAAKAAAPAAKAGAAAGGGEEGSAEFGQALLDKIPKAERKMVGLNGRFYDVSQFIDLHPGGEIAVDEGEDISERFKAAHGSDWGLLERAEIVPVDESGGTAVAAAGDGKAKKAKKAKAVTGGGYAAGEEGSAEFGQALLDKIPKAERKMVGLNGRFYDVSQFVELHPGGKIAVKNGEDLSARFKAAHGSDWALLERNEIVSVDETGDTAVDKEKEPEHHLANYGGKGGSWRELMGRHGWFVLHSFAAKFPDYPREADRKALMGMISAFGHLYPCKLCRKHLQQQLRDPELGPMAMNTRTELTVWICKLHNIVNKDIGKPLHSCNALELDMMYLKNCGECEVEKKGEAPTDASAKSGYHPTTGPWDLDLWMQDQTMLEASKTKADLFKMKRAADLVDSLTMLKVGGAIAPPPPPPLRPLAVPLAAALTGAVH
jgi:cytochrome b involved in lipid metabolism